jgi:EPS-associated MarR family transcriptional regulator
MNRRAKHQEDTHFRVLRLLQDNPQITQRELAERLGVSLGATNYLLRALMDKGAIKIQNFQASKKKLSYVHLLTTLGVAEKALLTTRFLSRKRAEYEALKPEIQAVSKDLKVGEGAR